MFFTRRMPKKGKATIAIKDAPLSVMAVQLGDVLQETEEAVTDILTATSLIAHMVQDPTIPLALQQQVGAQVARIYTACGFQDISGQRIKLMIRQLEQISAHAYGISLPAAPADSLLNGPERHGSAPAQAEIDRWFSES